MTGPNLSIIFQLSVGAGPKVSPGQGNRFGVDYRGNRPNNNEAQNRSNSRDARIPKVNNYTKVMSRISPARAQDGAEGGGATSAVFDRLYGRSRPGVAVARSQSKDRKASQEATNVPPKAINMGR